MTITAGVVDDPLRGASVALQYMAPQTGSATDTNRAKGAMLMKRHGLAMRFQIRLSKTAEYLSYR